MATKVLRGWEGVLTNELIAPIGNIKLVDK